MNPYSLVPCDGHQLNFALWYAACVAGNDSKRSSPFRISVLTQQHPISVSTNHYVSYIPYWCSCSTCYIMSLYMFLTWLSYREGWRWWWGSNHPLHLVMQGEKETTKPFKETKKTLLMRSWDILSCICSDQNSQLKQDLLIPLIKWFLTGMKVKKNEYK